MRKRRLILGILAAGNLAALLIAFATPHEPTYKGETLTAWLEKMPQDEPEVQAAVRSMGSKAVPWLVAWVANGEEKWILYEYKVRAQANPKVDAVVRITGSRAIPQLLAWIDSDDQKWKANLRLKAYPILKRLGFGGNPRWRTDLKPSAAMKAFSWIGPDGRRAVPQLSNILHRTAFPNSVCLAGNALSYLGQDGLPTIAAAITNPASRCKSLCITIAAEELRPYAPQFVPPLIQALNDTNARVAARAANVLGVAGHGRWPVLTNYTGYLNDPSPEIRLQVTNAIRSIAPGLLTNAAAQ
jgi:hypothetical protein